MTGAQKLIADFYGNNLIGFYTSAQDDTTLCVEVREGARLRTATVLDLAASIMRFKRNRLSKENQS